MIVSEFACPKLRMIFVIICLFSYLPLTTLYAVPSVNSDVSAPSENDLVAQIGDRCYSFSDLTGLTKSQFKTQVVSEANAMTNEQIKSVLRSYSNTSPSAQQIPLTSLVSRAALVDQFYQFAYLQTLDQSSGALFQSAITDRIVKAHQINLSDYFDLSNLQTMIHNEDLYTVFLYDHQSELTKNSDKLYDQAVLNFGLGWSREQWKQMIVEFSQRPHFMSIPVRAHLHSPVLMALALRAALGHYLVQDACEKGIFHDEAKKYYLFRSSSFVVVGIKSYSGRQELLGKFLAGLVDSEGDFAPGGLATLKKSFARFSPTVIVSSEVRPGELLAPSLNLPTVEFLYEPSPQEYQFLVYNTRAKEQPADITQGTYKPIYSALAYQIVANRYSPSSQILDAAWKPNTDLIFNLALPGVNAYAGDVKTEDFIKLPYKSGIFDDFENNQPFIDEDTLDLTMIQNNQDDALRQVLLRQLASQRKGAKTKPVQNVYDSLITSLSSVDKP